MWISDSHSGFQGGSRQIHPPLPRTRQYCNDQRPWKLLEVEYAKHIQTPGIYLEVADAFLACKAFDFNFRMIVHTPAEENQMISFPQYVQSLGINMEFKEPVVAWSRSSIDSVCLLSSNAQYTFDGTAVKNHWTPLLCREQVTDKVWNALTVDACELIQQQLRKANNALRQAEEALGTTKSEVQANLKKVKISQAKSNIQTCFGMFWQHSFQYVYGLRRFVHVKRLLHSFKFGVSAPVQLLLSEYGAILLGFL